MIKRKSRNNAGETADSLLDIADATGIAAGDPVAPGACFVLDCIDDLVTKAELIAQCLRRGLRVLSLMGAGLKSDPTRLHIAKLVDRWKDRLAMRVSACGPVDGRERGREGCGRIVLSPPRARLIYPFDSFDLFEKRSFLNFPILSFKHTGI